jgi:hypothetical protein
MKKMAASGGELPVALFVRQGTGANLAQAVHRYFYFC